MVLALSVSGATYKGKSIDGKKYACTAKGDGVVIGGTVQFDGRTAYLYHNKTVTTLRLDSEAIDDPKDIQAGDWSISITDEVE